MRTGYIFAVKVDHEWYHQNIFTLKSVPSLLNKYNDWQEYKVFDCRSDVYVIHKVQLMGQEVNLL